MKIALIMIILSFCIVAEAFSPESVDVCGGLIWIGNGQREDETLGAPSPLTQKVSIHVPFSILDTIIVEPGFSLFRLNYAFSGGPRPRPAQIEHREMLVVMLIFDINIMYPIAINDQLSLAPGLSSSFILRFNGGTAPGEENRFDELSSYFTSSGRFYLPGAFARLHWAFAERVSLVVRPGVRLPLFNVLGSEPVPFYDQLQIYNDIGFAIRL